MAQERALDSVAESATISASSRIQSSLCYTLLHPVLPYPSLLPGKPHCWLVTPPIVSMLGLPRAEAEHNWCSPGASSPRLPPALVSFNWAPNPIKLSSIYLQGNIHSIRVMCVTSGFADLSVCTDRYISRNDLPPYALTVQTYAGRTRVYTSSFLCVPFAMIIAESEICKPRNLALLNWQPSYNVQSMLL